MPADMDALLDVARRHDLRIVEDNCVSQSTLHRGRMCGTLADAGAISLQHGKLTSAGEGGVFFTDDPQVYQRAASRGHYERLQDLPDAQFRTVSGFAFGEKYRIATITAAIGAVQMRHWDEHMARRKRNAEQLGQAIEEVGGFSFRPVPDYVESPYHQGWVRFTPEELGGIDRETLIAALQAEGRAGQQSGDRRDQHPAHRAGARTAPAPGLCRQRGRRRRLALGGARRNRPGTAPLRAGYLTGDRGPGGAS